MNRVAAKCLAVASILGVSACSRSESEITRAQKQVAPSGQGSISTPIPSAPSPAKEYYTCPMHPEVHSDQPGECPICHMRLVKKTRSPESAAGPSGRGEVVLTALQQVTAGIQSVAVEEREMTKTISMPGRMSGGTQVSFQVFEEDLGYIRVGASFSAQSPSLPGVDLSGRIMAIDSLLDPMSRTGRVVGAFKNPELNKLKVESSVVGAVRISLGRAVALPEAAVLHTGSQDLVYLEKGPGKYIPWPVVLGPKTEGFYQVIQGLDPGARVAAGPNFLLDSESRIRATYDQTNH